MKIKHTKMSLNTAVFEPSPQAWESGTKEGEQDVSSVSCPLAVGRGQEGGTRLSSLKPSHH